MSKVQNKQTKNTTPFRTQTICCVRRFDTTAFLSFPPVTMREVSCGRVSIARIPGMEAL